ncbi:hypothetical protein [Marivita sp. GX14005]|uniref:hypothetical protein n=1 Tax=Marivita sp. GX14005 TaxID=2942276 RepID=UPI00201A080C|nr:hypothetical protein [Marivita sp. GX14005]MCL3882676.1 hypothetical protein [Marivita sp. GX14005]
MKNRLSLFFVASTLSIAIGATAQARPAKCLLEVQGKTFIDGSCEFHTLSSNDGSFQITGANGMHFAYLYVEGDGKASAYWNGEIGENRAHDPLGTLTRDGACWSNTTAKLCAW